MDSDSYKSFLPTNTDFLDSEPTNTGPIPETIGSGGATETQKVSSPEAPKNPDREKLIGALGEKIDGFFTTATARGQRIIDSTNEIKRSGNSLEDMAGHGRQLTNNVREVQDPRAGEISNLIAQTAHKANENADDIRRSIGELHADDQMGFIKGQERIFAGPGMEEYQQQLRDALNIENSEERSAKLEELKSRITSASIRINQAAKEGHNKSLSLKNRARQGTASIPGRLSGIHDVLPRLREKMGNSYYDAVNKVQEMGNSYANFKRGFEHMDSLPVEFQVLSSAVHELGVGLDEIFEAFAEGKYT